jgi:SAM-dependent methyltransferase
VTDSHAWVPEGVDITVPNASRVYDYALGGVHNFTVDREFWHQAERVFPEAHLVARANRAFLGRAVRWLVEEQGITQFLDIGSGIPTLGNVHEAAQEVDPRTRVMYVDIDPVAVEQSRSLLRGNPYARAVRGDLRDPEAIVSHEQVAQFFDFSRPIAVLMVAVLHFIPDEADPRSIVSRIGAALMPGSFLVLSHVGPETSADGRERQEIVRKLYERTPTPLVIRDPAQLLALVGDGFDVLDPGVVSADRWRPDPEEAAEIPPQPTALVAVARLR